jgi:hypothetical protein
MRYFYHKDISSLERLKFYKNDITFLKILTGNDDIHPRNSGPISSFICVNWSDIHIINHVHDEYFKVEFKDFISVYNRVSSDVRTKFCFDFKRTLHLTETLLNKNYNDMEIFVFYKTSEKKLESGCNIKNHYFKDKTSNVLNLIIPLTKHVEDFTNQVKSIAECLSDEDMIEMRDVGYRSLMEKIIPFLFNIEKHGIHCDPDILASHFGPDKLRYLNKNFIYNDYNILSQTGRPSNAYYNINFSALNKTNGERAFITSRFGEDGMLVLFDFKAYHPRLISTLINYQLPSDIDFYEWITSQMSELTTGSKLDLKSEVFTQIYGKIEKKYLKIDFFDKTHDFIKQRWKYFTENGFITTPIYKRKIRECHINSAFPNKVLNYMLQAYETERNSVVMETIIHYLESNNKLTVPIKYDYDSILFDSHKSDGIETIKSIKRLLEDGNFPITVKVGRDFDKMVKIKL